MNDASEARLAKNEVFFREANEFEERDAALSGKQVCSFICECSRLGCITRLSLTRTVYEHVRAKGDRFLVLPGHEDPSIEVVVERHPSYLVVEKRGEAGVIARSEDPR